MEVIWTIDWTGEEKQLAAAKERHTDGDLCVYDPMTGEFLVRIPEMAARLYVADVLGDWREVLVASAGTELHIYENTAPTRAPDTLACGVNNNSIAAARSRGTTTARKAHPDA